MKWAIVGLIFLGLAAAGCAAMLVGALRAASARPVMVQQGADADVQVLYATRPIPIMSVVDSKSVATKTVRRSAAPAGYISDPVQVVGRIMIIPMVEGQPFTNASFPAEGNSTHLATVLPSGKRAVGISVTEYGGLEGFLYPGSKVDVLVSFKSQDGLSDNHRPATSTTLLTDVEVLAIERQTVVSNSPEKVGSDVEGTSRPNNARRVTLLVDVRQAAMLGLAMEQGTLSLALRNPLDVQDIDRPRVSLDSILGEAGPGRAGAWETMLTGLLEVAKRPRAPEIPVIQPVISQLLPPQTQPTVKPPQWDVTVLHGQVAETISFPMPAPSVVNRAEHEPLSVR